MFDNEIIPVNEKMKLIRELILATQEDVSEGICTRNNISRIENGKQRLIFSLADSIVKKYITIAKMKKINLNITVEDLMMDEDNQANNVLTKNIIKHLHEVESLDLFEKKLIEAEKIIEKYHIVDEIKIKLYKLAANFYYNQNRYNKSNELCNKGLRSCLSSENILEEAHFYVSRSRNSTNENYHEQSLEQLNQAEKINNIISNEDLSERILLNRALTYRNMNKHWEALTCLDNLKDKLKTENKSKLLTVSMLCANCLNDLQEFEKAELEFNEILHLAINLNDKDIIAQAYRNLSEVYYNKKNYKVAAKYIKESLKDHPHNYCFHETLYFAAKVLKNVNEDVEMYLLRSLELCEKKDIENLDLIEAIIYELILIYMKRDNEINLELMIKKTEELSINCNLIYTKIAAHYRYRNRSIDECLINKIISKNIEKNKYLK